MSNELTSIAKQMIAPGKGILAADESTGTMEKRLASVGAESTEDNRRAFREILFITQGIEQYISGVILFDETIRQATSRDVPFPKLLADKGVLPGIKVDQKTHPLAGAPGEVVTEGLDGLRDRLAEYKKLGAKFAKWRAVITIEQDLPSDYCLDVNAHALARYAALCQEAEIVPIVEPEVLMDGDHTIERCFDVTKSALAKVFNELKTQRVDLNGIVLKPNMVISGKECTKQENAGQVAEMTLKCFREVVPEEVPGIVFLSGGQTEEEATNNLQALNDLGKDAPWELSFSYGRALQTTTLKIWQGKSENAVAAQAAFLKRAKLNSLARDGKYSSQMEQ